MAKRSRIVNFTGMDAKRYEQAFVRHDVLYRNVLAAFARDQVKMLLPVVREALRI
jgi:hypothetical protein